MKRILLTGMSGTGKSSVIGELAALGYKAIDTDDGWCEPLPDGRQRWREDAIAALLDAEDADVMFIAGCEENQVRFHPRFDLIILLIESGGFVREEHHAELAHGRVEPPLLKGKALGVSLLPPRRWRMA